MKLRNIHIEPRVFLAVLIVAVAVILPGAKYAWNHYRYSPSGGLVADVNSELSFALADEYHAGDSPDIQVLNSGQLPYTAYLADEACNFELYDSSGRIILQDYHEQSTSYTIVDIQPTKTTFICTLPLTECTQRNSGECIGTEPLQAGAYRMLGKFSRRDGVETTIEKKFTIAK